MELLCDEAHAVGSEMANQAAEINLLGSEYPCRRHAIAIGDEVTPGIIRVRT